MDFADDLNICSTCGGTELELAADGFMYCTVCASQSQNFREECFDDEQHGAFSRAHVREYNVARNEALASQVQSQLEAIFGDELEDAPFATFLDDCGPDTVFGSQYPNFAHQVAYQYTQRLGSKFAARYLAAQIEAASKAAVDGSLPSSQDASLEGNHLAALADPKLKAQVESILFEKFSNSLRKTYIQGLERIMQMQCETLMEKFKVNPLICGIVASVWPRFLTASHVYDRDWAQEAMDTAEAVEKSRVPNKRRVKKVTVEETEEDGNVDHCEGGERGKRRKEGVAIRQEVPRTSFNVKATDVWLRALKQRVPLKITLAVLYLACYMAREPILPTDITGWASEGSLPYLAAFTELVKPLTRNGVVVEEAMHFPLNVRVMFQPNSMTSARNVEFLAGHIADRIGLRVPPVNFHGIFRRFSTQLGLPVQNLMIYGDRLHQWYTPAELWLSARFEVIPTRVYVMAMLVVILKVFYNLDGRRSWVEEDAMTNEAADRLHHDGPTSSKSGLNEAGKAKDIEKDLASYTKYCQDVIFPRMDLGFDEQKFQARCRRLFENDMMPKQKSRENMAGDGDRSGSNKGEAALEASESKGPWGSHESRVNVNRGLHDTGKNEARESPEERISSESDSDDPDVESLAFPGDEEEVGRRWKVDVIKEMDRMGFKCTSPFLGRSHSDGYTRYSFVKCKTGHFSVHKDYFTVLQVCSKVLNVHPKTLHVAVQHVEKGLRKVEVGAEAFITSMQRLERERTEGNKEPGTEQ